MSEDAFSFGKLEEVFESSPEISLHDGDRYVIFSDLHMGNGSWTDDFVTNSEMLATVLSRHYLVGSFNLILNGDVEELQRFSLAEIQRRWAQVYAVFERFHAERRVHRIVGNHDYELLNDGVSEDGMSPIEGLRFRHRDDTLFIFHGHQALWCYERFNRFIGYVLKYALNPLRIRNRTVAHDSRKRFLTEKRVYEFSSARSLLSIIGHTHRPLFESMSKIDTLRFEIERLCRAYPGAGEAKQHKIELQIKEYQRELEHIHRHNAAEGAQRSLYNADLVVPCVFNSGCVLGKRGMTALEIQNGTLALVHWFDAERDDKYLRRGSYQAHRLGGTSFYRVVIKQDSLDYIFSRIKLLT